jgi:hypothetical protein
MLDFPRFFSQEDVFAVRTMLWWNRHLSITLQLKGRYAERFSVPVFSHLPQLAAAGFYINNSAEEWDHDLDGPNYQPLHTAYVHGRETGKGNTGLLKLAQKFPAAEWNNAEMRLPESFQMLMNVLKD